MNPTVLLRTEDLQLTRHFYCGLLGFSVQDTAGETLTVEKEGGKLIFTRQDLWKSKPQCSGTFYFAIPDLDAYYEKVRHAARIAWPLQAMAHGSREFGVVDCNGYHLAFQEQAKVPSGKATIAGSAVERQHGKPS